MNMNAIAEFAYKMNCVLRPVSLEVTDVETPFSFAGNKPICFRIETTADKVKISDNADALFHLSQAGINTSDQQGWHEIRQITGAFGIEVTKHGQILGIDRVSETQNLALRFLSAMLALAAYERKKLGAHSDSEKYQASADRLMSRYIEPHSHASDPSPVT
jgi:hypothetical protein